MEYNAVLNILLENAELSSPEVYVIDDRDTAWALDRLGLSGAEEKDEYTAESVSDLHELVMCQVSLLGVTKKQLTKHSKNNLLKCVFVFFVWFSTNLWVTDCSALTRLHDAGSAPLFLKNSGTTTTRMSVAYHPRVNTAPGSTRIIPPANVRNTALNTEDHSVSSTE